MFPTTERDDSISRLLYIVLSERRRKTVLDLSWDLITQLTLSVDVINDESSVLDLKGTLFNTIIDCFPLLGRICTVCLVNTFCLLCFLFPRY